MSTLRLARPEAPEGAPLDIDQVLRELAPRVRQWVYRHAGSEIDLEDCMQEALIEIASALERFEGRSKLTTYARRIAIRTAVRVRRRVLSTAPEPTLALVEDDRDPETLAMQRESLRRLYRALDKLSDKRRAAFVLCDIEKLSHAEAAEVEGVDIETLRARLKHSRADLRRRLAQDPYLGALFRTSAEGSR